MSIVLFDNHERNHLYPLSLTSAVADLRLGIFTFKERWEYITGGKVYIKTEDYLQPLYQQMPAGLHTWIDASLLPGKALIESILSLQEGEIIADETGVIACCIHAEDVPALLNNKSVSAAKTATAKEVKRLKYPWQIFQWNDELIRSDFELVKKKSAAGLLPVHNQYIAEENIIIEKNAAVQFTNINAAAGPVYIGKNVQVMEGACIRGPFAALDNAVIKMGAKIYGATTIGPACVVGGEIKNAVFQSHSNKSHDGYVGDAVIASWCNLGAGTSNSNVKNTGSIINVWHKPENNFISVAEKCGCIIGAYSRTAINTSINCGTVIGVCCNIFSELMVTKYIPHFTWGNRGLSKYEFEKALKDIANWKKMKKQEFSEAEAAVLQYIFENEGDD